MVPTIVIVIQLNIWIAYVYPDCLFNLELKVGYPIILLQNIALYQGLWNRLQLVIM